MKTPAAPPSPVGPYASRPAQVSQLPPSLFLSPFPLCLPLFPLSLSRFPLCLPLFPLCLSSFFLCPPLFLFCLPPPSPFRLPLFPLCPLLLPLDPLPLAPLLFPLFPSPVSLCLFFFPLFPSPLSSPSRVLQNTTLHVHPAGTGCTILKSPSRRFSLCPENDSPDNEISFWQTWLQALLQVF